MIETREDRIRFETKYRKNEETGCWEWVCTLNRDGYGMFAMRVLRKGKAVLAHRASYSLYKTFIPEGLLVLHRCDNPCCVNPDHLFLGTSQDNFNDMVAKGRACWQKNTPIA